MSANEKRIVSEPSFESFKKGDYKLHVFLEEARALLGDSPDSTTDPVVLMSCFGKLKSTKPVSDVGGASSIYWGEHFFFSRSSTPEEMIESGLTIEVKDHNKLTRDSLIGSFALDLSYIYAQENHSILHKWVILSNPSAKNYETVRGYLKFGVSLTHEDDKPTDLTVPEDTTISEMDILMPPEIKPQSTQVVVTLLKAENLPVLDSMSKSLDAYCTVKIAGTTIKTKVIQADTETLSAYWYEALYIPFIEPSLSHKITLIIADQDTLSPKDDLVGSISFNWRDVKAGAYGSYFWSNFYGAPSGTSNEEADKMCMIDSLGSHWRGRVLLSISCVEGDEAVLESKSVKTPEIIDLVENEFEGTTDYLFKAMVFTASSLPKKSGKYSIRVQFCEIFIESSEQKASNGRIDWYELLPKKIVSFPVKYEENMSDVFVYLMEDGVPVSFKRLSPQEFFDPNAPIQWLQLDADKSLGKIKNEWEAGMVGVRIHITSEENPTDSPDWKAPPSKPEEQEVVLLCNLYQCRNLPAADSSGLSDPYIKIYVGGYEISTKDSPKENTLNPSWYSVLPLKMKMPVNAPAPPIWVFVWDWDRVSEDDLIGLCKIEMSEAQESSTPTVPHWRHLEMGRSFMGEILISFNLCHGSVPSYSIEPEYEEADIEINVLGLRDLKPAVGYLPVNKAFVKFDLKGLRLTGGSLIKNSLQSQPKESGRDPNINTVLSFSCQLPKDGLFCPALTCTVHDQLFAGLMQPHIGTFSLNLGDFKTEAKQALKAKKAEAKNVTELADFISSTQSVQKAFLELADTSEESNLIKQAIVARSESETVVKKATFLLEEGKLKEVNQPDSFKYMEIGYNRVPDDGMKHYRMVLDDILENSEYYGETPFKHYSIKKDEHDRNTGIFKGLVKITPKKHQSFVNKIRHMESKNIDDPIASYVEKENEFDEIKEKLLVKTKCLVRVYILDAFDLEQKDRGSHSDPYLRVKLGKTVYNDVENRFEDTPNPRFFKQFDFETTLPGESMITVQLWDYDSLLADDKIGSAKIDIEDRYFSKKFMGLKEKPIETRPLMHKTSRVPQGYIRMWIDILPLFGPVADPWDISLRPPAEFEARMVIWKCEGVENMDFEGVSDLYVRAFLVNNEEKETDTHFRCQSGKGSWNWRLKFPVTLPRDNYRATIQIWDQDYFSRSDFIAEATFTYDDIALQAWESGTRIKKYGLGDSKSWLKKNEMSEQFWVDCQKRNKEGGFESGGKVMVSFELVPKIRAEACPVGDGRQSPNIDPYLPPPVGRFEWSLNPLKLISQFCGPEFKFKICCAICCAICVLIMCFILPVFFTDSLSVLLFK